MKAFKKAVASIGGVALVGLGASMVLTNPGQDTYETYAVEQLTTYLKDDACMKAPSAFGNLLQRQCKSLVDTGRPQIEEIISQTTQRQNFVLFSIYQTTLDVGPFLPAYHFDTVGVFQNFFVYQADEQ
jgi:hypothetical protein